MASTIGIVTIGQSPRDDLKTLFAGLAPPGSTVILRGCLDGMTDEEVDGVPPENGDDALYTALRGGRDVKISKKAVIARAPAALAALREDGAEAIVFCCTGEFPPNGGRRRRRLPIAAAEWAVRGAAAGGPGSAS